MTTQDKLAQALRDLLNSDPDGAIAQATDAELAEAVADASADPIVRSQAAAVLGARKALAAHEAKAQAVPVGVLDHCQAVMDLIDDYVDKPTSDNRHAIRSALLDIAAPQPEAVCEEKRLTQEARVGGASFGIGVPERLVVEAAQRAALHPQGLVDESAKQELQQLIADNAGRAAFLESHPAVSEELAGLIEENERLRAALAAQQAEREGLTEDQARKLTRIGPVHCDSDGIVKRSAEGYRQELQSAAIRGIRIAERAHGIGKDQS
jgi:hypothetical protein